ncbi:NAD(P)-dependent oxidoreductase [Actinomadura sp. K4S16]|uniref:NAD-dependent epimerase/dehydratase family protein n=1 Tax=Actinomadura sp. K4S16 TaxID=1316147 RepID=UPI0011EBE38A|nr:NAD(P)-dependent oxidoreductase [Actinomadura sp. K4S16]
MRVFVAGATGAVGRFLVPLLLEAGHQVTGTARTRAGLDRLREQGAIPVQVDVFDAGGLVEAVAAASPDAVIHQLTALAKGTPADNGRIRREGTRNLVDAAVRAGVTRIVAQSVAWAYAPGDPPAGEDVPLDRTAPPPRANMIGGIAALEETAAELDEHVVLRYGTFYGKGTWYSPDGLVADVLRGEGNAGRAAAFVGRLQADDGVTSFVHVEDAARAAVAALDWPSGPVNIVDDEPAAARDWLPVLAAAFGAPPPPAATGRAGWQRGASNARARSFGWRPRHSSWRTGFTTMEGAERT